MVWTQLFEVITFRDNSPPHDSSFSRSPFLTHNELTKKPLFSAGITSLTTSQDLEHIAGERMVCWALLIGNVDFASVLPCGTEKILF